MLVISTVGSKANEAEKSVMQKRVDEYFAKAVLESCFSEKFSDLQISDKPDLRCGIDIGIEVTTCTLAKVLEAENIVYNLKDDKNKAFRIERVKKLGAKYSESKYGEKTLMIGFPGRYTNDIDASPSKAFIDAVAKKIDCLNREYEIYADMPRSLAAARIADVILFASPSI